MPTLTSPQLNGNSGGVVVVAASNTPAAFRQGAQFICTGTNDHSTINQAIQSLPGSGLSNGVARGGKVALMLGDYFLSGPVTTDRDSVTIEGVGTRYPSTLHVTSGFPTPASTTTNSTVTIVGDYSTQYTLPVTSTAGFASSGALLTLWGLIYYTGTTANSFTGCVGGVPPTHTSGSYIIPSALQVYQATGALQLGSNTVGDVNFSGYRNVDVLFDTTASGLIGVLSLCNAPVIEGLTVNASGAVGTNGCHTAMAMGYIPGGTAGHAYDSKIDYIELGGYFTDGLLVDLGTSDCEIQRVHAQGNSSNHAATRAGIHVHGTDIKLLQCHPYFNQEGIFCNRAWQAQVIGGAYETNTNDQILFDNSGTGAIVGTQAFSADAGSGTTEIIHVKGCKNVTVTGNEVDGQNSRYGIDIDGATSVTVTGNTVRNCSAANGATIEVQSSHYCTISGNNLAPTGTYAIRNWQSDHCQVSGNTWNAGSYTEEGTANNNVSSGNTAAPTLVKQSTNWPTSSRIGSTGTATLVAGTVTVANQAVTSSSQIRATNMVAGGTVGALSVVLTAGTSFTINSSSGTDTSTVLWEIVQI